MKTPNFAHIIRMIAASLSIIEEARQHPELNGWLIVYLRRGDPNDLHLSFLSSEAQMDLLVSGIMSDFNTRNTDEFIQSDCVIVVGIEEVEDRLCMLLFYHMFGLNEGKVFNEII